MLQKIGDKFITELSELRQLEKFVNDKGFIAMLGKVKQVCMLFCFNYRRISGFGSKEV